MIEKEKQDKNQNEVFDKCVNCGKPSPYPVDYEIEHRNCYIDCAGQLCVECFTEIYNN